MSAPVPVAFTSYVTAAPLPDSETSSTRTVSDRSRSTAPTALIVTESLSSAEPSRSRSTDAALSEIVVPSSAMSLTCKVAKSASPVIESAESPVVTVKLVTSVVETLDVSAPVMVTTVSPESSTPTTSTVSATSTLIVLLRTLFTVPMVKPPPNVSERLTLMFSILSTLSKLKSPSPERVKVSLSAVDVSLTFCVV